MDTGDWTPADWMLYYELLVDYLYDALGPAADDVLESAEEHVRKQLNEEG